MNLIKNKYLVISYALIFGALWVWLFRTEPYQKPLTYYIFITLGSIAIFGCRASQWKFVLPLICGIGLMHIWTENMLFPSLVGLDPYTHMQTTTYYLSVAGTREDVPPLTLGNLGGSYSLMHVYLKWIMELLPLDYKMASLIFWGSLQTVGNIILVFLIGKALFNAKVGLLASLMVANANWVIFFGEWMIPNGIGATLSLLTAYIFIKAYQANRYWLVWLTVPIIFVAMITQFLVLLWVLGTILVLSLPLVLKQRKMIVAPAIILILGFLWLKVSSLGGAVATGVVTINQPMDVPPANASLYQNYWGYFSPETLLNVAGMGLYFGVALIGFLLLWKHSIFYKAWLLLSLGILGLCFIPPLFHFTVIEHRWMYFAEVITVIPLALVLIKYPWAWLLAGVIIFLSIMGLPSNLNNRDLSTNQIVRYGFTDKELEGLTVAKEYQAKVIGTDGAYAAYVRADSHYIGQKTLSLDDYLLSGDFSQCQADVLLLRTCLDSEPMGWGNGSIYRFQYNPSAMAQSQGYKKVWANGEIDCLVRGGINGNRKIN